MTQEEKQLLLKDLCARLPYGVKVKIGKFSDYMLIGIDTANDKQPLIIKHANDSFICSIDIVKPYLRPMSSMTEGERRVWMRLEYLEGLDWLNVHHFDYRGLIEKGLASGAPEGIYETK